MVGNVESYTNRASGHTTSQKYEYDDLYQLKVAEGNTSYHPNDPGNSNNAPHYSATYRQTFDFDIIGNMTEKTSTSFVSNQTRIGANLNYNLDYSYAEGTHRAQQIGNRYYSYDRNGNVIAEREGSPATNPEVYRPYYQDNDLYWTEYGFGLVRPEGARQEDGVYQRNYRWNERNLLSESSDSVFTVQYRYGADGQRAIKYVVNHNRTTLYFNNMWHMNNSAGSTWVQSKHIYLGETRITTKYSSEDNQNLPAERNRIFYYHSDHLGSAQTVTSHNGSIHERLEYTPYGEMWIDWKSSSSGDTTPFRFTAQEFDPETGLYYYGARYLDPRISRWLSVDPAMGEYVPVAPVNDDARKHNQNLPGMGGVFNIINLHTYRYAGNNPIKYVDPDGEAILIPVLIIAAISLSLASCQARRSALSYEPHLWNDGRNGPIQSTTNCYAYALNLKRNPITGNNFLPRESGSFALQPGDLAGIKVNVNLMLTNSAYLVGLVEGDAIASGRTFKRIGGADEQISAGNWRVALVLAPGFDYHWYRQNDDGTWSHKLGESAVTNLDHSGAVITNPETASRGAYTQFVGYFEVGP